MSQGSVFKTQHPVVSGKVVDLIPRSAVSRVNLDLQGEKVMIAQYFIWVGISDFLGFLRNSHCFSRANQDKTTGGIRHCI